ncbi:hypothetical protein [Candidatus Palauibacter sp.]|uniref:hypothetical protein n=1 Tax=Candidatus Palauibacter sp. TaxID=3101350 RepID=UPI003AF2B9EE
MTGDDVDISDWIFTPPRVGHLADQLEEALGTIGDLKVRIPKNSRLPRLLAFCAR